MTPDEHLAHLHALWVEHEAAKVRHKRRLAAIEAARGTPPPPPVTLPRHECAATCGHPVTASDWTVHDPATGRHWHAWCWHATEAPGQRDLLDLLATH